MRVLVVGATGALGRPLSARLHAEGHEVVCLGRRPGPVGEHRPWDARTGRPDLTGGIDAVIHLAAAVGEDGGDYRAVNVGGARRLLAAVTTQKVVWVSSASVYSPGPYRAPVREDQKSGSDGRAPAWRMRSVPSTPISGTPCRRRDSRHPRGAPRR